MSIAISVFCVNGVYAQDQPQEENGQPKPAAHAPLIDPNAPDTTTDPNALTPDTSPLTGVQNPGLGSVEYRHSYWAPGIQVANTLQSGGNGGNWFDTTYLAGNLSLSEAWAHSHLALNYSGGGYFSTNNQGDGSYQQLGFMQSFDWRRWQLQFFDEFAYLPTSQFGFGGLSGIGTPGIGGSLSPVTPLLGGVYLPNQTILAATGPRYSNSFAAQANLQMSRRSSITLTGSYGLLRFTDPGNIDNDDEIGSIGYNYELTKKDTLGLLYRFTAYHFTGLSQAIGDHAFNVAYGRKVTGRLGLSLFAGPEIVTFRVPIGTKTQQTSLSLGASLTYGFEWGAVSLSGIYPRHKWRQRHFGGGYGRQHKCECNAASHARVERARKFRIWPRARVWGRWNFHAFLRFLLFRGGVRAPYRPQFESFFWLYRVYREYQSGRMRNRSVHCRRLYATPTCRWISMAYAAFRFAIRIVEL